MTDRFIITAEYTDQPPINSPARQFTRTRSVSGDCLVWQAYSWACKPATDSKHVKLDRVTVTPDG